MRTKPRVHPLAAFAIAASHVHVNFGSLQRHEHGYELLTRTNPDHNLIFVTRGRAVWVVEGLDIQLSPGDLLVVPRNVQHRAFSLRRRVTLGSIHVQVRLPGGQDVFELLGIPMIRRLTAGGFLERYLHASLQEYDRDDTAQTQAMIARWATLIIPELIRHDAALGLLAPREADPLVAATLEKLQHFINAPLDLPELARWSGFSGQYLNRVFCRVMGMTPLRYLAQLRVERAARLLTEGTLTVAAVGRAVSFDDPYHFSRVFKVHRGISPEHYRRLANLAVT